MNHSWESFEINYYYPSDISSVFSAWSTRKGLKSFFIEDIDVTAATGRARGESERIVDGDKYSWRWRHGFAISGEFTRVSENKSVEFTFGSMKVSIAFKEVPNATLLVLRQSQIPTTEEGKAISHLNCRICWTFFLTNLKSTLLTGTDLRDPNPTRASSFEVGFQAPEL